MKTLSIVASTLLLAGSVFAQTCAFTNFGRPCGGALAGSQVRGPGVQMDVSGATAGAYAFLVVGQQQRPVALPGSHCPLLVHPRVVLHSRVDRAGDATFLMRLPHMRLDIDFQCITVELTRAGRAAESTNGVNLVCR